MIDFFANYKAKYGCYESNEGKWFDWNESEEEATLDGRFTPEELIAIARGMLLRKHGGNVIAKDKETQRG